MANDGGDPQRGEKLVELTEALAQYRRDADQKDVELAEQERKRVIERFPLAGWPDLPLGQSATLLDPAPLPLHPNRGWRGSGPPTNVGAHARQHKAAESLVPILAAQIGFGDCFLTAYASPILWPRRVDHSPGADGLGNGRSVVAGYTAMKIV
jgi:hypothetical protein